MMADLDQSGGFPQYVRTYLGPTVGWVMLPVDPETFIAAGPSYTVARFDSRVMLNATGTPVTSIQLPDVVDWVRCAFQRVQSAFDRSLWIKDYAVQAAAHPITVTPFGAQTIDGLGSFQIINNRALLRLYPLSNLAGWYSG